MLCIISQSGLLEDAVLHTCHVRAHIALPACPFPRQPEQLLLIGWQRLLQLSQVVCLEAQVKIQGWAVVLLPGL